MSGEAADYRYRAPRPALTPLFSCALAFWAASAACHETLARWGCDSLTAGALGVAAATAAVICLLKAPALRVAALAVLSALAGGLLSLSFGAALFGVSGALPDEPLERACVVLEEDAVDRGTGEQALGNVLLTSGRSVRCSLRLSSDEVRYYGDRLVATVKFSPADLQADDYAWAEGSCAVARLSGEALVADEGVGAVLRSVRKRAIESIGSQEEWQSILQAVACGYKRNVRETEIYADFQTCGLAHLIAVSGAHLVIVTSLMASVLKALRTPRPLAVVALVGVMASYLVLSGCPVSALRATLMSSVGILSLFGKRRPSSLNALGLSVFAIIALDPPSAVSVSFVLSALSTAGIVLFAPFFSAALDATPLSRVPTAVDSLSLTLASSALSQLYACSVFSVLPLVSLLANALVAPLFPAVCSSALAAGLLGSLAVPHADLALAAASIPCKLADALIGWLARIPYASIPFAIGPFAALCASAALALVLWSLWNRPRLLAAGACALVMAAAAFSIQSPAADSIVMLDVGQGDSLLVQSEGRRLLVDTGNQDSRLAGELARNAVTHLDAVLITHADDDHFGSLDVLMKSVQVDRVLLAKDMLECPAEKPRKLVSQARELAGDVIGMSAGDTVELGAFTGRVVWPHAFSEDGGNADSLCLWLDYDGDHDGRVDHTALLTGDAESDELESMIESEDVSSVDILKVGHHGSKNGMTESEVQELKPKLALIGVGARNRYGHPAPSILEMLEAQSCRVMRTDQDGEVACMLSPESIRVRRLS